MRLTLKAKNKQEVAQILKARGLEVKNLYGPAMPSQIGPSPDGGHYFSIDVTNAEAAPLIAWLCESPRLPPYPNGTLICVEGHRGVQL